MRQKGLLVSLCIIVVTVMSAGSAFAQVNLLCDPVGCQVDAALIADTAGGLSCTECVTSTMIENGTIRFEDISLNSCPLGTVMMSNGSEWVCGGVAETATWRYKSQDPSIRHIGPVAQDFYGAFGVGEDERFISTIDADGVALAAIQGLYQFAKEKDKLIAEQDARIRQLETALAEVMKRITLLEAPAKSTVAAR